MKRKSPGLTGEKGFYVFYVSTRKLTNQTQNLYDSEREASKKERKKRGQSESKRERSTSLQRLPEANLLLVPEPSFKIRRYPEPHFESLESLI